MTPDPAISAAQTAGAVTGIAQGLGTALPVAGADLAKLTASASTLTTLATAASSLIPVAGEVMLGAQLIAQLLQAGEAIFSTLNSPAFVKARENVDVQSALAKMDADLKAAQKSGDITAIDKEASG